MKILNNFNLFDSNNNDLDNNINKSSVVTIGNFDGIHMGHQKLVTTTRQLAFDNNFNSIVISFTPHPLQVLKNKDFLYILSNKEKCLEIEKQAIDFFINYNFTKDFSNTTPEQFINILHKNLNCKILIVGEDYCFGKNRAGNVKLLERLCQERNIKFIKISNIIIDGKRISSTYIREALLENNIKKANLLLNKEYYIIGTVCEGNKLGRTIGFPTANIIPSSQKLLPKDGVYVTQTILNNKKFNSVTNIGKNPTIDNTTRTVETYIFNFKENIYNKEIKVIFLEWIRDVKKFNNLEELKNQISQDRNIAKQFFYKNY